MLVEQESLYYAILSGEHPVMPLAELEALLETRFNGRILYSFEGIALFSSNSDPGSLPNVSGWIKEVGRVLEVGSSEETAIESAIKRLGDRLKQYEKLIIKKYKGYSCHIDTSMLKNLAKSYGLGSGKLLLRLFLTEGVFVLGEVISVQDTRSFNLRKPGKRPFFKPGPLSPQLSRVFVNLSRLPVNGVYLDPFCGTGGFVLEACLVGAKLCLCGDITDDMVRGARINLSHYGVYDRSIVFQHDSTKIPLEDNSVDAIATDPPYGRSTTTAKRSYKMLVEGFLNEASRVVKPGGYIVYAGPEREEPWKLAVNLGLEVRSRFHMHVHSTLVREVVVARKVK